MTPTLWSSAGFDCFGINRIDVWDKAARKEDKQLEFVWRGSSSLGPAGDMWTHVMDSHCACAQVHGFYTPICAAFWILLILCSQNRS